MATLIQKNDSPNLTSPLHIVLIGPPGAGKGTQASLLAQKYKFKHISSGDLLKEMSKRDDALGFYLRENWNRYALAKIAWEIVAQKIRECKRDSYGFVLSGGIKSQEDLVHFERIMAKGSQTISIDLMECRKSFIGRSYCFRIGR